MLPPSDGIDEDIDELAADLFASHGLAYSLPEKRAWRRYIDAAIALGKNYRHLTAYRVIQSQELKARTIVEELINKLRSNKRTSSVTLLLDSWTNKAKNKIINFLLIKAGVAYYWTSVENRFERQTGAMLHAAIIEVLDDLTELGINVIAVCADNESANNKAINDLIDTKPFLIHVPCGAHTIQLVVRDILRIGMIKSTMEQAEGIINEFRPKEMRLKLLQAQVGNVKCPMLFILPCKTRWSSEIAALARILQLQRWINVISVRPQSFWNSLTELLRFLKPFQIATDLIQSDSATLLDVYQQYRNLHKHCESYKETPQFAIAAVAAKTALQNWWFKQVNQRAVVACALLSFSQTAERDFSNDEISKAEQFIFDVGANYLLQHSVLKIADEDADDDKDAVIADDDLQDLYQEPREPQFNNPDDRLKFIRSQLEAQWNNQSLGCDGFESLEQLVQESRLLLKERAKEKKFDAEQLSKEAGIDLDVIELPVMLRFDARRIWIRFRRAAPELCAVACAFLTIAPTEAAVERSDQGNIHSKKRNRLKIEHVRNEMHIRFNGRALDKRSEQGGFVEMNLNDEYEPVQFTISRPIHEDSGLTSSSSSILSL